jgi:hypothetical protein
VRTGLTGPSKRPFLDEWSRNLRIHRGTGKEDMPVGISGKLLRSGNETNAVVMLHLFTDAEKKRVELCSFDGPVVGEVAFVNKLSSDGNLIRIDRRKRTIPMRFSYIPELSWANYF